MRVRGRGHAVGPSCGRGAGQWSLARLAQGAGLRSKSGIGWHGGPTLLLSEDWPSGRGLAARIGPGAGTAEN